MTLVQSELDDLTKRMLSRGIYNSKDTILVKNPPECQNGHLLETIISFRNSNLQFEFPPYDIKACHYHGKPQHSSVNLIFVYLAQKNFIWLSKNTLMGIVNMTELSVYLAERLQPKCRDLQLEAKKMGIKTATTNCELQLLCPRKEVETVFVLFTRKRNY